MLIPTRKVMKSGDGPSRYVTVAVTAVILTAGVLSAGFVMRSYLGAGGLAAMLPGAAQASPEQSCPMEAQQPKYLKVSPEVSAQLMKVALGQIDAARSHATLRAIGYAAPGNSAFASDPTLELQRLDLLSTADTFKQVEAKTGPCGMDAYLTLTGFHAGKPIYNAVFTLGKQISPAGWRVADITVQLAAPPAAKPTAPVKPPIAAQSAHAAQTT